MPRSMPTESPPPWLSLDHLHARHHWVRLSPNRCAPRAERVALAVALGRKWTLLRSPRPFMYIMSKGRSGGGFLETRQSKEGGVHSPES